MAAYEFRPGEYRTVQGDKAFVGFDLGEDRDYPLVGYIEDEDGKREIMTWTRKGWHFLPLHNRQRNVQLDLVPPLLTCKEAHKQWLASYAVPGTLVVWNAWQAAWKAALENQEDTP